MSEERKNNRKVISKGILTLKNNNDVLWDLKIYIDMVKIAQNRRGDLEKSSHSRPETALMRKAHLQGWLRTHPGSWILGSSPSLPELRVARCVIYAECLPAFLLEVWDVGTCWTEGVFVTGIQSVPWVLSLWWVSLADKHLACFVTTCFCENLASPVWLIPLGQDSWKFEEAPVWNDIAGAGIGLG